MMMSANKDTEYTICRHGDLRGGESVVIQVASIHHLKVRVALRNKAQIKQLFLNVPASSLLANVQPGEDRDELLRADTGVASRFHGCNEEHQELLNSVPSQP